MSKEHLVAQAVNGLLSNVWSVVVVDAHGEETNGLRFNMDMDRLALSKGYSLFQFNGLSLAKSELVERVEQMSKGLQYNKSAGPASVYPVLCDYLSQLRTVAIIVHQAELLSNDVLSVLSKLHSYAKRNGLKLKLLLVGDADKFTNLFNAGIVVDKSYLSNQDSTEDAFSDRALSETKQRRSWPLLGVVGVLAIVAIPAIYFLLGKNEKPTLESLVVKHDKPLQADNIMAGPEKAQSNTELLNAIRDSKLRDIEMQRNFENIERKYGVEVGVAIADDLNAERPADRPEQLAKLGNSEVYTSIKENKEAEEKIVSINSVIKKEAANPLVMMSGEMLKAIKSNDKKNIRALFTAGESIAAVNSSGENMLLMAAWLGNESLVKLALEYDVPTNQADAKGRTPLFYTAIEGNLWLSKLLLDAGAKANVKSNVNKTPLMAAVRNRHKDLLELLLTHDVNVNMQDHSGWSALFYAVWNDDLKAANTLLEHGAKKDLRDNDKFLAYDIAVMRGQDELAQVLKLVALK